MPDGGKGSRPRPFSVDQKTFDSNWNRIFNKDKSQENKEETFDERMWKQSLENMKKNGNEFWGD